MKKNQEFSNNSKGLFRYTKLKNSQIKELLDDLSEFYGFNLDFLLKNSFYRSKADKLYIFSGDLEDVDLSKINSLGMYFGTFHNERFRLSIEGSKFVKPTKNFIKLNEKSFKSYITAENLFKNEVEEINLENKCPFLIVVYENENLGCASIKEDIILTYLPKSRKLDYNKVF